MKFMMKGYLTCSKTRGPVERVRFLQMVDHGKGEYTKELKQWPSNDREEICTDILELQKAG